MSLHIFHYLLALEEKEEENSRYIRPYPMSLFVLLIENIFLFLAFCNSTLNYAEHTYIPLLFAFESIALSAFSFDLVSLDTMLSTTSHLGRVTVGSTALRTDLLTLHPLRLRTTLGRIRGRRHLK